MEPSYFDGDTLVGLRWFKPRAGQVVVIRRPGLPIIKRILRQERVGFWVEGDNKTRSTDSRQFGIVSTARIEALVLLKI